MNEKALERGFLGIGFRDAAGGREAYELGSRVAVREVLESGSEKHQHNCGSFRLAGLLREVLEHVWRGVSRWNWGATTAEVGE